MRNFTVASLAMISLCACATAGVEAQGSRSVADELKAYPEAAAGQTRHVITLPPTQNEDELNVEIIVGQTKTVDCNRHSLGGELSERVVDGWGYNYYIVPQITAGASTMMGCPPNSERETFVTLPGQTIVRYNSKLPLVVYTPENAEVRYRFWRAGEVRKLS